MVARKASLQHKVLLGYMILIMAVCGMVSILLYERSRMREIKTETSEIRRIRHDISTAHRYITELATYGESVIVWGIPIFVSIAENACKRTACYKY